MEDGRTGLGRRLAYSPALDGLRAVAVVGVLLYHAAVAWLPGGFLGVDAFFVLSGFLITSLLLVEWTQTGRVDLVTFWAHRARRLLPALLLVTVVVCIAAWRLYPSEKLPATRDDALATLFYVANWRFVLNRESYFDQYEVPSPLRHMWSLGIEEQFYLLFPLILIALLVGVARRPAWTAGVLGSGALASAALMAMLVEPAGDPSRLYYGTDTRAQELLVGATAAALVRMPPGFLRGRRVPPFAVGFAGLFGLTVLLTAFVVAADSDTWLYRGGFLVVSVATALLITGVATAPGSIVARLLSLPPLVGLGVISYGLYLWHWPVDVFVTPQRVHLTGTPLLLVRLALALALAVGSYFLVERPIRTGALSRVSVVPRRAVVALAIPVTALVVVATTAVASGPISLSPRHSAPAADSATAPVLTIVGDSVAASLAKSMYPPVARAFTIDNATTPGCGLGPNGRAAAGPDQGCAGALDRLRARTADMAPAVTLVMYGVWDLLDVEVSGHQLRVGTPEYASYLARELRRTLAAAAPDGGPVVLTNVPCYLDTAPETAADRNDEVRQHAVNQVIGAVAAASPNVRVADLRQFLCAGPGADDGIRADGVHFTPAGASSAWSWLLPQITGALADAGWSGPTTGSDAGPLRVMLLGDSVPFGLLEEFPASAELGISPIDGTKLGCGLFPEPTYADGRPSGTPDEGCAEHAARLPSVIDTTLPQVGVVFLGIGEQFDRLVDGRVLTFGTDEYAGWLTAQLESRIALFTARGIPVLVADLPCHSVLDMGLTPEPPIINDAERIAWVNGVLTEFLADRPQIGRLGLDTFLCSHGYTEQLDQVQLRTDGMHFTVQGVAYLWDWLAPRLQKAGRHLS